jgi:hypothetical protein
MLQPIQPIEPWKEMYLALLQRKGFQILEALDGVKGKVYELVLNNVELFYRIFETRKGVSGNGLQTVVTKQETPDLKF